MSNTEQKIAEEAWSQKLDRARERIGTLREEKGDREFVAAHASKGAIPRKEIEALRWLISQRFVVPETDNVQFALVLSLLQRLSQRPTPATDDTKQLIINELKQYEWRAFTLTRLAEIIDAAIKP